MTTIRSESSTLPAGEFSFRGTSVRAWSTAASPTAAPSATLPEALQILIGLETATTSSATPPLLTPEERVWQGVQLLAEQARLLGHLLHVTEDVDSAVLQGPAF